MNSTHNGYISRNTIERSILGKELGLVFDCISSFGAGFLTIEEATPVTKPDLFKWELNNLLNGMHLPNELKGLYEESNGFVARWSITSGECRIQVGGFKINSLKSLAPVSKELVTGLVCHFAYILSHEAGVGFTALVYKDDSPQVWFCNIANEWVLLAPSFSSYMRLLFVNLGIRGWQYSYSPTGIDPMTEYWLRLFVVTVSTTPWNFFLE